MKRFIFTVLALCLFATAALAQTGTTGSLTGTVVNTQGERVPGATITVRDNQTGRERTIVASDDGTFSVATLEAGTYTVTVAAQGFQTFVANEVKIDVGRPYTLNVVVEVGLASETVEVTAGADILNASTAQLSNTISPLQIQELPLDGRSPLSLTLLQAGTANNANGTTSINGQRTTFTNITRDGINVQDNFIRANATDFSPERSSTDDTGEFTITTQNADASLGYGAAQIQLITPRGQSEFNGALYIYNRNSAFAANDIASNAAGLARPFLNRNQYGGKISGPMPIPRFGEGGSALIRGRGFFFFNYERQGLIQAFPVTRTVLTNTARQGIFTYTDSSGATRTFNLFAQPPASGGNALAPVPTGISPFIQQNYLDPSPLPNVPVTANQGFFQFNPSFNRTYNYYTLRLDYDISDRQTINGVYTYKREDLQRPDVDGNNFLQTPPVTQPGINSFLALAYRITPTPGFTNEVRGGYSFPEANFNRDVSVPQFFLNSGLINEPIPTFLSQGRFQRNYNLQDNAQWTRGNHSIRFGGLMQIFQINPFNEAGAVPTFTLGIGTNTPQFTAAQFPGGISAGQLGTANALYALLGGIVSSGSQTFQPQSQTGGFGVGALFEDYRYENYAFYINDQWRVSPRLTINVGIRYELTTPIRLLNGLLLEPVIGDRDPLEAILDPNGQYQFIGGNSGGNNRFHRTDKNNFGPNISIAWTPSFQNRFLTTLFGSDGRTVIRGGFRSSYVYDSVLTALRNAGRGNAGLGATALAHLQNGVAQLNARPGDIGSLMAARTAPAPFTLPRTYAQNNTAAFSNFGTVFAIDPDLQNTRTDEYNFGIQREIGFQTAIEIRYVGSRSNTLLRGLDYNQIDIFNNGFLADFNRARANLLATGNPFNGPAGPTQIFGNTAASRLRVGTGGLAQTTFESNLRSGIPADLALNFITGNFDVNANGQFPFLANPNTGVADLVRADARYNYNSLQMELRRRFSQGLYFQANYTFAKNLTDAVGTSQALFDPALNNADLGLEYSRADYDQTHAFNFNTIYQLPFGRGRRFLNEGAALDRIFGGFQFSTLLRYGSGRPITIVDPRGTLNRGARATRQTANTNLSNADLRALFGRFEVNGTQFFINPAVLDIQTNASGQVISSRAARGFGEPTFPSQVFFNVAPGQTGNMERAILSGPWQFSMDAALVKNIQLTEGTRIQLRMEAFNALNHVNYNFPLLVDINSQSFGQFTASNFNNEPRRLQFAIRFEF